MITSLYVMYSRFSYSLHYIQDTNSYRDGNSPSATDQSLVLLGMLLCTPHTLLVHATRERFLPAGGIFRAILTNESHWLQQMLVLSVQWWPTPAGVGRV